ncbi:hypothetical protein EMA8858_03878 [Emticicia aquatica]|uniref:Uncharacterized protein n=1 Tax=Emticicia aquatica TaxID=1681835 RepID=A0ABM9AVI8_9BACT|nr:hypothetical protein [Emticicia aquatica]CAH0997744.1 hypothetical protein EMA8858_03878 [Emticicia aquatica]
MKKQFYSVKPLNWIVVGCFMATLTLSCSVGLHHQQMSSAKTKSYPNLVEIYTDKLQPMPDSLHTIVALTPMTGTNVDSLFKGGDKFVIQYPTDLNQGLPAGIDVLYLNADYATLAHGNCGLLGYATSNNNIKIMIDGSVKNIEKFCKAIFNIYNPQSALMVYENIPPDSSAEADIPYGGSTTMAFGKKYNPISYDMLIESIFDFSVNDKLTVEDFRKAFEYEYDPKSPKTIAGIAKMQALRKQYAQSKPQSVLNPIELTGSPLLLANKTDDISSLFPNNETPKLSNSSSTSFTYEEGPYCDWSRWNEGSFNYLWNNGEGHKIWANKDECDTDVYNMYYGYQPEHDLTPNRVSTHINNPGADIPDKTFYRGYYKNGNEYKNGESVIWPVRRLNCKDGAGTFSWRIEKTWSPGSYVSAPRNELVLPGVWVAFSTKSSKSGYLDFGISQNYSKSYGLTRTGGFGYSDGVDVVGYSIETAFESSWSKSNSQEVSVSKTANIEYWFGPCMIKVANPIYGKLQAWTKTAKGSGEVAIRMRMVYVDQRDTWDIRALQFEIKDGNMPKYSGTLKFTKNYWSKALWKKYPAKTAPLLTSKDFGNCGVPQKRKYY